jgi:hypothetical protein
MSFVYRIIITLLVAVALISSADAYIITLDAPDHIYLGSPLTVTGNTSFPEGTYFDIVLFYSKYTAGEITRQKVIIDESRLFRSDFETRDLQKGQYKVEVHNIVSDGKEFVESSLGSSSVTRRVITIVDRSDEIMLDSSQSQELSTALVVTGKIKDLDKGVVTLRAFGPEDFTFGPQQLITTSGFADKDGHFSTRIPITLPGEYQVSLSDKDGFIGELSFNVTTEKNETLIITPTPTATLTPPPVENRTQEKPTQTPMPTPTKSPMPWLIGVASTLVALALYRRG